MDSSEIFQLADKLNDKWQEMPKEQLAKLKDAAETIGSAWSGSWLGYHARIYYNNFQPIPAGARFSKEWGFMDTYSIPSTQGDWAEYAFDDVVNAILKLAGNPDMEKLEKDATETDVFFEEVQARLLSLFSPLKEELKTDQFFQDLVQKVNKLKVLSYADVLKYFRPSGQQMSRDMLAIQAGLHTPPHIHILAQSAAITQPYDACEELSKLARRAASHIENLQKKQNKQERIGTNVFIGHGQSKAWKDLKDFIQDRLHLPWDEFNRVPIAGFSNIARLSQMLDSAAIAFLIMTAEDEQVDGKLHARLNVVHEAGLFQGRLGFERAIILLEEGCEEFSNIHGLGQIRFPKGNITAVFEDIRKVLERESIITE